MSDPSASAGSDRIPDSAYRRMTAVLRLGLLASVVVLLASLVTYLLEHPGATSASALASNPILRYLSLNGLASGLAGGHIEAYLTLGLLALLATPILRVLTGFYYFRRAHERYMAAITFTVFVLILVGLLIVGPLVR